MVYKIGSWTWIMSSLDWSIVDLGLRNMCRLDVLELADYTFIQLICYFDFWILWFELEYSRVD